MHSIRIKLAILFVVVTTMTLGAFGLYGQYTLSRDLHARFEQVQSETLTRLGITLPAHLWSFEAPRALSVLRSEMQPEELRAIVVYDKAGAVFARLMRDANGQLVEASPTPGAADILRERNLDYTDLDITVSNAVESKVVARAVGRVVVYFSDAPVQRELRKDMVQRALEILVADLVLVAALVLSLQLVFKPLEDLKNALYALAESEGEEVKELPETRRDEFGDVVKGFNQTQRKLRLVVERSMQAEHSAREEKAIAEKALLDLHAVQQSLVQSEKLASLGGLVAGVAHEINTPLGIALTGASVVMDATKKLKAAMEAGAMRKSDITNYVVSAEEGASLILSNAERAAQLVQNFKQVAADQTSELRRQYELSQYIDEVMSSLRPRLKRANVQVDVRMDAPITLDGYPGAMAQVLTNLTMNTLAHAFAERESGQITISAVLEDQSVTLQFQDNGRGIPPDHLKKIFDPFFTTRRGQGGTGLGLNIVHNIVAKQFAGHIAVTSELGVGTCFTLHFPSVNPDVVSSAA